MRLGLFRFTLPAMVSLMLLNLPMKAGGPWLLPKGQGYAQVQTVIPAYAYERLLMGVGTSEELKLNRSVFAIDFGIYAEYGISDKLDIMANIPLKYAETGDVTDTMSFSNLLEAGSVLGLSNVRLALKHRLNDGNLKAAVSFHAALNTTSKDLDKGLITGFDATGFGPFVHVGGSFHPKWYAFGELGYLKYTNDFSDVLEARAEIGRYFGQRFTTLMTAEIRQSLENGSFFNENLIQTGLYPNNQEWAAVGAKVNYETASQLGANFGVTLIPIQFRYVGFTGAFTLSLYKKW